MLIIHSLVVVVDKTAAAVVKVGLEFQERIRENASRDPKFSFVNPGDPYHKYYSYKVKELSEGVTYLRPMEEEGGMGAGAATGAAEAAEEEQEAPPKEPEPFLFLLEAPPMAALDM